MAVIRQQTQVFNKPVGVRRVNTGEAEVWEQVAAQADNFRNRAFQKAAVEAEQAGKMKGMAVESGDIVAIDPETNEPIAFKAPSNFGSIAAASYQDIITRRFEQSVDNELKTQGSYYAKNASNADEYKIAISSHVGNMIKAGGDDTYFSRYIEESGQAYVDSTYVAMKSKELEASILQANTSAHFAGVEERELIKKNIIAQNITGVNDSINKQKILLKDLLNVEYYTRAQYQSELDSLRGLESLMYNTKLTTHYVNLPKNDRINFLKDLDNPNNIEDPNLKTLVVNALATHKKQTLIEGLNNTATRGEDVFLNEVQQEVAKRLRTLNSNMSPSDIDSSTLNIEDENVRDKVRFELKYDFINKLVNFKAENSKDAALLINEFRKPVPDNEILAGIIRKNFNKDNDISLDIPQSLEFMQDLTSEDRISIAENISARLPSIRSIESSAADSREQKNREQIRNIRTVGDFRNVMESIKKDTALVNKDTLLNLAKNVFADRMNQSASSISLSYSELQNVSIALGDRKGDKLLQTPQELLAFKQYKDAHAINPSSVNAAITSRLKASEQINLKYANEVKRKALTGAIDKGIPLPTDDMKFLQKEIMGDEPFLTVENIGNYEIITDAAKKGIIFPAFSSFLNRATTSTDEVYVGKARELFEQNTQVKVSSDGVTYTNDMLIGRIKPETYRLLSAATIMAREEQTSAFLILSELRSYDGNVEADALSDLNGAGLSYKKLINYFDDRDMTQNYKKQFVTSIKMRKARGMKITEDLIEGIVEDFAERKQMFSDDNVVGNRIDGAAEFPLMGYLTGMEIVENRNKLTMALYESNPDSPLLRGGTTLDQYIQLFRDTFGMEFTTLATAFYESFKGGYDAKTNLSDKELIRRGQKVINTHIKWKPDEFSFSMSEPKWTAGFINDIGQFQEIRFDGVPWTITKTKSDTDKFRSIAHNEFIAAQKSSDKKIKADAYIKFHSTLDHVDFENLKKHDEYDELLEVYGSEARLKLVFNNQKDLYEQGKR